MPGWMLRTLQWVSVRLEHHGFATGVELELHALVLVPPRRDGQMDLEPVVRLQYMLMAPSSS